MASIVITYEKREVLLIRNFFDKYWSILCLVELFLEENWSPESFRYFFSICSRFCYNQMQHFSQITSSSNPFNKTFMCIAHVHSRRTASDHYSQIKWYIMVDRETLATLTTCLYISLATFTCKNAFFSFYLFLSEIQFTWTNELQNYFR